MREAGIRDKDWRKHHPQHNILRSHWCHQRQTDVGSPFSYNCPQSYLRNS